MSSIPANVGRTSSLLLQQIQLSNLNRTNLELFQTQTQLSTGRAILRPSQDAVKGAAIGILDDRIDRSGQILRNLDAAASRYDLLDNTLSQAGDFVLEAKQIASEQVNLGSTAEERQAQSQIVNSLINGLFELVNSQQGGEFLLGGTRLTRPPFESFGSGFRYVGETERLTTDTGLGRAVPVTLVGQTAIGDDLARVRGTVDLAPDLALSTRLSDVRGAAGRGVAQGDVVFSYNGGDAIRVDLDGAQTIEDVVTRLDSAIRAYETNNEVTILGPGGVSIEGQALTIDVAADPPNPDPVLAFGEVGLGTAARDLGLMTATDFSATSAAGSDLSPRLTFSSPISSLTGLTAPLDQIRISNAQRSAIVDLSDAETLEDIKSRIEASGVGGRVQLNEDATGINIVNEVSADPRDGLSIEEIPGGENTATLLGIRTFSADTQISGFNDGRGVRVISGSTDPETGLPDPEKDIDFTITLGDGTTFPVDLRPQDVTTVGNIIARINDQAASAGIAVPGDFEAGLSDGPNGLRFAQNGAFAGEITIEQQNNSPAAEHLGLSDGAYDAASATFAGEDRAKVAVDSVFTRLIALRNALGENSDIGITIAGGNFESSSDRVAESRALVGGFARRVSAAQQREQDLTLIDEQVRSELRDVDIAEGATRLTLLQNQLSAGLQLAASSQQLSLLNFLG